MNEEIFWGLIEKARAANNSNFETQCVTLTELLTTYSEKEILDFEHLFLAKLEEASTFPIMAAAFVVCSFISDDTYEDFRAWLVGQGKEKFHQAIANPDVISTFLERKDSENLGGEYMLFVGMNAYLDKTDSDDEDAFFDMITHPDEKELQQNWPENKEQYRKMFPALYDKFWNEARIKAKLEEAENEE